MKEERTRIYEEYETLKLKAADGDLYNLIKTVEFVLSHKLGNSKYWIKKLDNVFSQKLAEKSWEDAFYIIKSSAEAFRYQNEERAKLRKQLAEALYKDLDDGSEGKIINPSEINGLLEKAEVGNPRAQTELKSLFGNHCKKENSVAEKDIYVGTFWGIPDNSTCKQVIAGLGVSAHLINGNKEMKGIIHSYSHVDVYKHPRSPHEQALYDTLLSGEDTFDLYPKFRIVYDADNKKHIFYVDECIKQECIDEAVSIAGIENYEVRHDDGYVCPNCRHKYPALELKYNILRGHNKIGENLIEISYGGAIILVELGKSLDGSGEQLEQEILNKEYSAVVVSHYHEDHAGLIKNKKDCHVYIGGGAYRVLKAMGAYRGEEMPENITQYHDRKSFGFGSIKVTPFLCDHSAYDSYMLLFEAGGQSILYTGDFRFHGRKDSHKLLSELPESVDVLIHEGTNIGKSSCTMTEAELENKAVEIMKSTDGPVFVLQSGTNIDRLVSIYRASKRSGRITYMDNYTSHIAQAAGGSIPRPDVFADVIAFTPRAVHGKRRDMFLEIINKRGLKGIANGTKRFTMLVRPSMAEYIKKLVSTAHIEGATLIYSMWNGYKENEDTAAFLNEMKALGVKIVDLHTSGHASTEDIELLKRTVNAKQTVCVHTES